MSLIIWTIRALNGASIILLLGLIGLPLTSGSILRAQSIIDCVTQGKVQARDVRGMVVDPTGFPAPGAVVTLESDGSQTREAETDAEGRFHLNAPAGQYKFKVTFHEFIGVAVDLQTGRDLSNAFSRDDLHVVLGPFGSFCSLVTTSHREFTRRIEANKQQLRGKIQNNATQK